MHIALHLFCLHVVMATSYVAALASFNQGAAKKKRSDITPDPGGHRPQHPCAQDGAQPPPRKHGTPAPHPCLRTAVATLPTSNSCARDIFRTESGSIAAAPDTPDNEARKRKPPGGVASGYRKAPDVPIVATCRCAAGRSLLQIIDSAKDGNS